MEQEFKGRFCVVLFIFQNNGRARLLRHVYEQLHLGLDNYRNTLSFRIIT